MMPSKRKDKNKKQKKHDGSKEDMPTTSQTEKEVAGRSTTVNMSSSPEQDMDELWEKCVSDVEALEKVRREKKRLLIEKALKSAEDSEQQRRIERIKAKIREISRLRQERERLCRTETEEHQQKLPQLASAHHSEISEQNISAFAVASKTQMEHMRSEVKLEMERNRSKMERVENSAIIDISTRQRKQKDQAELWEDKLSNIKEGHEIVAQYVQRTRDMFENMKTKKKELLKEIDERMGNITAKLIQEQMNDWEQIKHFTEKHDNKTGKGKLEALKDEVERKDRKIRAQMQKNKDLKGSLREMESKLSERESKLAVQRKIMVEGLKKSKKQTASILQEKRDLYLKHQVSELKYVQAQQEDEELQRKNALALTDTQQASCLKALVLDRQIKTVTESLSKEQLELSVARAFTLGDQTAANNIEALFTSKHAAIEALKDDISGDLMEYNKLLVKATASDPSVDKWLSVGGMEKSIRRVLEDSKNSVHLIQELMTMCISEDKDALGLNPVSAESRQ